MRGVVQVILLILVLFIGVPLVIGLSLSNTQGQYNLDDFSSRIETPEKVKIWIEEESRTKKLDFEEYVSLVVASEMPSNFEEEALKAQAVAVRTYAMSKIESFYESEPASHPKAALCNTTHCQVYKSEKELIKSHEKGWEDSGLKKIKKACKETEGQLLYYEGSLVTQPLFFSSSGGQTENSEDVFSGEYPYLVSVASPYEEGASHSNEQKAFLLSDVSKKINEMYTDRNTGNLTISNIKILSRTAGGRVDKIQLGQSVYKGTEVRSALGLSSALFSFSFSESGKRQEIVFTTNGYGHGVGMSQYGANGMAKEGKTYKEILTHYYTGTNVY